MAVSKIIVISIAIMFGVNLLVTGLPIEEGIEAATEVIIDDNSTGNGTHKEL